MTASPSEQTRRNRVTGGRRAAEFTRRRRAAGPPALAAEVARDNPYGPEGSHWGSAPVSFSIADTLARIRAAQGGET